jgi:hypothetical protein
MEEYKFHVKLPKWMNIFLFTGMIFIFIHGFLGLFLIVEERISYNIPGFYIIDFFHIILYLFAIIFSIFGFYFVFQTEYKGKYYFLFNKEGISVNCVNISKKQFKWDSEICYMITDSYFKLYEYKNMRLLHGKILNEKNVEQGIISLKLKRYLKVQVDNKNWITIYTKYLREKVLVNDILIIINQVRNIKI